MFPFIDRHDSPTPSRNCGLSMARGQGRALAASPKGRRRSDEGISLVEVLVASVILLVTMIPIGYLLTSATSAATQARQTQAAQQLADAWIQILSNSNVPTVPGSNGATPLLNGTTTLDAAYATSINAQPPLSNLAGTQFTAKATYTYDAVNDVGQSDLCLAGTAPSPTNPAVLQLKVTVSWGRNTSPANCVPGTPKTPTSTTRLRRQQRTDSSPSPSGTRGPTTFSTTARAPAYRPFRFSSPRHPVTRRGRHSR